MPPPLTHDNGPGPECLNARLGAFRDETVCPAWVLALTASGVLMIAKTFSLVKIIHRIGIQSLRGKKVYMKARSDIGILRITGRSAGGFT
jgi:hypothetical protein